MANVNFDKKIFEKEIGRIDDALLKKIAMFGTPVEEVREDEIELEIFPNRPDLLSYSGFKRSFLAFLGKKTKLKKYKLKKPEKNYKVYVDSSVKDIRPYTVCAIVKKIKLDDKKIKEIIDLQEKIHNTLGRKRRKVALGIYPLDKIKLPITFKAIEPDKIKFQPLEFPKEISGLEILQKHPTGKEYAPLLAGKTKFPIFIDSANNILSMPPIINSELTGKINIKTKELFIECSGSDIEILKKCLNIVITTFYDIGGEIYQMKIKGKISEITPNLDTEKKIFNIKNAEKLLGIKLNSKLVKNYLEKMGYNYDIKKSEVEIPSWRTDILHEVDLIEDIAIAYGYDNFKPEIPEISTIGKESQKEIIKRKISEILIGLKMIEMSNYHLTTKKDQYSKMNILEKKEKNKIQVEESKTEYNLLRNSLTPYLLKNLSENINAEYPQKIFEIGKIFELENNIIEKEKLAIALTPGYFTESRQILEYLSKILDIKLKFKEPYKSPSYLIEGRVAEIEFENSKIGYLGEISPKILKNWRIKMPVALIEIDLEKILENLTKITSIS